MVRESNLQDDLTAAMRAREMEKVYVLRGLLTAIKNLRVEQQARELAEADLIALVRRELNKRTETIGYAEKAGRTETVTQNERERQILQDYLPPQLEAADLEETIRALAQELNTVEIGPLMSELRKRHAGTYDGKLASEIIRGLA